MRKGHKKGFLLVEVLIAIFILIMVSATGISLVVYGYRAINYNGHSMEASWLAQEGANALRGLRDTNWLRFGYDKENCWNMAADTCAPENEIREGVYTIQISPTDEPILTTATSELNLADGIDDSDRQFQLHYQDLDLATDIDGDGIADNDHQYVSHNPGIEESKFFRTVTVNSAAPDTIEMICSVQWLEGSQVEEIALPVIITNYMTE
jgi:type II secretory pathway pseudopilin PulG